jgi:hypothetical protein
LWILMFLMKVGFGIWQFDGGAGRNFLILQGICIVVFGAYLWQIKQGYSGTTPVSTAQFFDIMKFRAAHHYFPNYFGWWNWLFLSLIFLYAFGISMLQLQRLFAYIILGCVVYVVGAFVFHLQPPLSMQWFSTTVWLKTFALIILMRELEELTLHYEYGHLVEANSLILNVLMTAALACAPFIYPPLSPFKQKSYDLPFWKNTAPEVRIAEIAKQNTSPDALFLVPMDVSAFRYWSERNTFVDFKAANHQQNAFVEWYGRMFLVYQLSVSNRIEKADLNFVGNTNFRNMDAERIKNLAKTTGVTHILTFKDAVLSFPKVGENEKYVIYKID